LKPKGVEQDDYDLKWQIDSEIMGAETGEIEVKGTVNPLEGEETEFQGTIKNIKYYYEMGKKFNEQYKIEQLNFHQKEWLVAFDKVDGKFSDAVSAEVVQAIVKNIEAFKAKFEAGAKREGLTATDKRFPMDAVIPTAAIYYAVQAAEIYEVKEDYILMGYNLYHWKMLTDKQNGMLKKIEQDFYNDKNKDGYEAMM
jgi:hypothetical protein